jgi:hypothetical protein
MPSISMPPKVFKSLYFVLGIFPEWDIFQFHTGGYKRMSRTFIGVSPIFFNIPLFSVIL